MNTLRTVLKSAPVVSLDRILRWLGGFLPKGLYARSLIIIIAPMVLLQSIVAYAFMERHWQLVTRRLSSAVNHVRYVSSCELSSEVLVADPADDGARLEGGPGDPDATGAGARAGEQVRGLAFPPSAVSSPRR